MTQSMGKIMKRFILALILGVWAVGANAATLQLVLTCPH
jgi:hypothetical protein